MNKKNDKILILLLILVIVAVLSWFILPGVYNSGVFSYVVGESEVAKRCGIYDLFTVFFAGFYERIVDIFYIFIVGGCYGVLSHTKSYRKLVDKTAEKIKGKEVIVYSLIVILTGLFVSVTNNVLALFCIVPFIVSLFLRNGYNRITAISAAFGGIFVGSIGQTFGSSDKYTLLELTGLTVNDWIGQKWVLFIIACVLYILFSVLYMKKHKKEEIKYDIFAPEYLDEKGLKKKQKTNILSTAILFVVALIIIVIGCLPWTEGFGIDFFDKLHENFQSTFMIMNIPMISSIVGSQMSAFGTWSNGLLPVGFIMLVYTVIVSLINKETVEDFTKYFGLGIKKVSKIVFIYVLVSSICILSMEFSWPVTLIDTLFGESTFNIVTLLMSAMLAIFFYVNPYRTSEAFSSLLLVAFADNLAAAATIWNFGTAVVSVIAPTSLMLMVALTYADIPYKNWVKYIWKFFVAMLIVALLFFAVVVYV